MQFHVGGVLPHAVLQPADLLLDRALQRIKPRLNHFRPRHRPALSRRIGSLKSLICWKKRENRVVPSFRLNVVNVATQEMTPVGTPSGASCLS